MIKRYLTLLFLLTVSLPFGVCAAAPKPNFLVFIIDDLNDYVGALGGHPNASTPNIDRLAQQGILFTNAHCNSPVCNPSRTSLFTGLRPSTTGITSNRLGWFREVPGFEKVLTLPEALAEEDYTTFGFGKTFHRKKAERRGSAWAHSLEYPEFQRWNSYDYGPILNQKDHLSFKTGDRLTDWGILKKSPQFPFASHDRTIAQRTINVLFDTHDKPFLVACGFYRPHTPLYAQKKWFDLHPLDEIALPEAPADDRDDLVYFGKRGHQRTEAEIEAPGLWDHPWITKNGKWKDILQAYLASTSSMDAELGRVLDALEKSPHRDNTYVFLFSDHGWNLGEKEHWGKAALWEQTTRVPFIAAGPGIPKGKTCDKPVELLSLYPTLADLAEIEPPAHLEGHSLRPLLKNPNAPWNHAALTTFCDHHALRTDRHRYIRYANGSEELYDHKTDPDEFKNLAVAAAKEDGVKKTLSTLGRKLDDILSGKQKKKGPVPVIFDTDITGDVDDVLALAMLHSLADRDAVEILAVTISKENPLAAPFVDAVNTFYGRPDIPIGVARDAPHRDSSYLKLAEEREGDRLRYPRTIGVSEKPKPAVDVLKQALRSAEDNSVAMIQVGLATNLADLLASEGGAELISQKADHLSVMAGGFNTINGNNRFLEANVRNHVPSMQALADRWPNDVPVIWSGFSIGIAVAFPRESIAADFGYVKHHPVREAYLLHSGPDHDRPTWDLTSVLYSVFPDRGFFDLSPAGRVSVEDDGFTRFVPAQGSRDRPRNTHGMPAAAKRDRYLEMSPAQVARVREALVHLVAQPPHRLAAEDSGKAAPVKLIFDTDMGNDIDDAMALAMIHALEKRGACELLAVTSTKDHPLSAAFIDAVNTFYGRPGVPIGAVRNGATPEIGKFNGLAGNYPHDLRSGVDAPEAVSLLRKTLATQPDGSVSIAQVGFFTNLSRLLESPPDDISPLNGVDLVKAKVRELAIMAGSFQTIRHFNGYKEYNVIKDIPSARKFAETWPSPIVWSGFEIGIAAAYPWESIMKDFGYVDPHPIAEAYLAYAPWVPHDRPTWDLTAVLHTVYPDRGYFDLSPRGRVTIEEDGFSSFLPGKKPGNGRDRFLIMDEIQAARIREAFVQLTSEPPGE